MGHYVYILRCADKTLYTGYTIDLERRVKEHNQGKGAKYTRGRSPVELVYSEEYKTRSKAQTREYEIKKYTREKKLDLVENSS